MKLNLMNGGARKISCKVSLGWGAQMTFVLVRMAYSVLAL